jgi:hypothetical protein
MAGTAKTVASEGGHMHANEGRKLKMMIIYIHLRRQAGMERGLFKDRNRTCDGTKSRAEAGPCTTT